MQTAKRWAWIAQNDQAEQWVPRFWQTSAARLPFVKALLWLLLSVDLGLILLHILFLNFETFGQQVHSITFEKGYGELYQVIKAGWVTLIFLWLGAHRSQRAFWGWVPLFGYVMVDDFFALHENIGAWLADRWQIPPMWGLRPVDFGEFTVYVLAALCLLPLIAISYWRGSEAYRADARTLLLLVALLALFGVGVDMVHTLVATTSFNDLFGIIEDGGEMVVMSLVVWFALLVLARATLPPAPVRLAAKRIQQ